VKKKPKERIVDFHALTRAERHVGEVVAFADEYYLIVGVDSKHGLVYLVQCDAEGLPNR